MNETMVKSKLDPVTFEVLKNAFINLVDQMSEQILRTCYSFVIYNRDFSSAICDAKGNTIMQGTQDLASHVGTLHLTAKAVIDDFGDDIHSGDVFIINDPYRGGTHFSDVRIIRPIFHEGRLISFMQSCGHWADVGGAVPGSFDVLAQDHFGEGLRIPPTRIWSKGKYLKDVANMMVSNMRVSDERLGDLRAQAEATKVSGNELLRLIDKYGVETVLTAFDEVKDYVERLAKARVSKLPNGTWEGVDYIDMDPNDGERLIPVKVKMTIKDDEIHYDLSGSNPSIGSILNTAFGGAFSATVAGTKSFFPDIPLNSGFYRVVKTILPEDSVVNASWPVAVTGFCSGAYEKIMNVIFEIWSNIMPERAIACSFNLEYLLIGGNDKREGYDDSYFMMYDWMAGGHGGRNGRDGSNALAPIFGLGLSCQPIEGQERLAPIITTNHEIITDSGGPGEYRGGCGIEKGGRLEQIENTIMSYNCDRSRSIPWGIFGGLPSIPHGAWLNKNKSDERYLGTIISDLKLKEGDDFTRPSAGGGGLGDPLKRKTEDVLEDVIDGYVSIDRAKKDYGVIIQEIDKGLDLFEVDLDATEEARNYIKANRKKWMKEDISIVQELYTNKKINNIEAVRKYGVIIDLAENKVLEESTKQYREMLQSRTVQHWS